MFQSLHKQYYQALTRETRESFLVSQLDNYIVQQRLHDDIKRRSHEIGNRYALRKQVNQRLIWAGIITWGLHVLAFVAVTLGADAMTQWYLVTGLLITVRYLLSWGIGRLLPVRWEVGEETISEAYKYSLQQKKQLMDHMVANGVDPLIASSMAASFSGFDDFIAFVLSDT